MNTPTVSILVPIYNVSNFIERCAHSLFQQTFDDIEYVFVNDCTPDDSIEKLQKVLEQYSNRKSFVKIIHHEKNRGLAAARNTAIDNSCGKYIQHVDSDDWIEPNMIERMYEKAQSEQADIVVCDFFNERATSKNIFHDFVPKNQEDYFSAMISCKCAVFIWNKFFVRRLFDIPECRPVEGLNILEDKQVSTRLYYYAKKIVKIDSAFYHYNKTNINALTVWVGDMHFENIILLHNLLDDFLKNKGLFEKYSQYVDYSRVMMKIQYLFLTNDYNLRKKYSNLYRNIEFHYLKNLHFGEKVVIVLTHYKLHLLANWAVKFIRWKNRKNMDLL